MLGTAERSVFNTRLNLASLLPIAPFGVAYHRTALDPAARRSDLCAAMAKPPTILLPTLPAPARRIAGFWLLTLSLWLASAIALFR